MKKILALAAVAALVPTVLVSAPQASADVGHGHPATQSCSLNGATLQASASTNTGLTRKFATYGNTSRQWSGADSTYSVTLKNGTLQHTIDP